jgi:hypothetical protein
MSKPTEEYEDLGEFESLQESIQSGEGDEDVDAEATQRVKDKI